MRRGVLVGVLHQEFPESFQPTVSVTSDPAATGTLQAQQCKSLLGDQGSILVIGGPEDSTIASNRLKAFEDGLRGTNIRIIDKIRMPTWNGDNLAMNNTLRVLKALASQRMTVDLIACQNDSLAMAAKTALGEMHLEKIPVLGIDGTAEVGQKQVNEKFLRATIITPSASGAAIQQLHRKLTKGVCQPRVSMLPASYPLILRK